MGGGARPMGVSPKKRHVKSFNKGPQIEAEVMGIKTMHVYFVGRGGS